MSDQEELMRLTVTIVAPRKAFVPPRLGNQRFAADRITELLNGLLVPYIHDKVGNFHEYPSGANDIYKIDQVPFVHIHSIEFNLYAEFSGTEQTMDYFPDERITPLPSP